MKIVLTITYIMLSFLISPQQMKLEGKYKMQYEQKYIEQNCIIIFKGNTYIRQLPNGKIIKGNISYNDFNITLVDKKTNLQMDFLKRDIQKDTIYYGTKNITEKPEKEGKIIIYSAKLIRMQ
jgi:hypothetical protein